MMRQEILRQRLEGTFEVMFDVQCVRFLCMNDMHASRSAGWSSVGCL